MRTSLVLIAACAAILPNAYADYVIPPISGANGWEDSLTKAKALVSQMTTEEKLNLTQQLNGNARVGTIDRLGYSGLFYADGSEGIRGWPFASAFDQALNAAASFDRDLMYRRAVAMGAEARAKGINVQFGPGVNQLRTPMAGRGFEYFGGDPYLSGAAAIQHVKGMQSQNVMAMMRHYVGNDQESGRTITSSNMDERTAHEIYLWPFQDAVHAGVVSTMCSYNALNGTHSCGNPTSLGRWLHEELNFQGWVLSDYQAVPYGQEVQSANAGLDSLIGGALVPPGSTVKPTGEPFGINSTLSAALNGTFSLGRLDDMAHRIVAAWYQVGQDQQFPPLETNLNALNLNTSDLIRELGAKSIVLLKNEDNVLPLQNSQYVYVFGQSASVDLLGFPRPQQGSFSIDNDMGTFAGGQGSSYANLPYLITLFEALQARARKHRTQVFSFLNNYNHTLQASYAKAGDALNATCIVDVRQQCSEGYDRANLSASWEGDQTILSVASACSRTVVAYSSCGPMNTTSWYEHPNVTAILDAGGLGQEAGHALADVLYGDVNPSAKLPYTIGKLLSDYAAVVNFNDTTVMVNGSFNNVSYSEGLFTDYRWFDKYNITPAFEFGFGLSYTTFGLSNLSVDLNTGAVSAQTMPNSTTLFDILATVSVDVTNTGDCDGTEVPQLYLGSPAAGAPIKTLRGFEAVPLSPGETKTVQFPLTTRDLSYWDVYSTGWMLPAGEYQIYVGTSSRDIKLSSTLSLQLQ